MIMPAKYPYREFNEGCEHAWGLRDGEQVGFLDGKVARVNVLRARIVELRGLVNELMAGSAYLQKQASDACDKVECGLIQLEVEVGPYVGLPNVKRRGAAFKRDRGSVEDV